MDFSSSSNGSEVYILRIQNGLNYLTGVLKNKVPTAGAQPTVNFTVEIDGQDINYNGVPGNLAIVQKGTDVVALSSEAICEHIKTLVNASRKELGRVSYHETIIKSGEELLEKLNPEFAATKQQEKLIQGLQQNQANMNSRIDTIEEQTSEILKMLKGLKKSKLEEA